nr:MAG TPA: hypothetical protein [Caudoviricetes sp.]DAM05780.1 MAG TPA: hypothetical protein [Caudoviricetes sp.]DAP44222.1 MAG TPA: hypothetical protein [Caudoviricetes sp.]
MKGQYTGSMPFEESHAYKFFLVGKGDSLNQLSATCSIFFK